MKLKRRWMWLVGVVSLVCIGLVISLLIFSRETHAGYKRGLILGDNGWELRWVKATALPPDWDSTFKVICKVPAEVITNIFPEFSTSGEDMREKLKAFRADLGGAEAYAVEIDPDKLSTRRKRGMYSVSLPGSKQTPKLHVHCTMILPNQGHKIRVSELEGHEIVYISKKVLKLAIEERLHE